MAAVVASCLDWTRLIVLLVVVASRCDWTVAESGLIHTASDMTSVSSGGVGHDNTIVKAADSQATIETIQPFVFKVPQTFSVLPPTPEPQGLETESSRENVETKDRKSYERKGPKFFNLFPNKTISPAEREPISTTTSPTEREPISTTTSPAEREPIKTTTSPTEREPISTTTSPAEREPLSPTTSPAEREPISPTTSPAERKPISSTTNPARSKPVSINMLSGKAGVTAKAGSTPVDNVGLGEQVDPALNTDNKEFLNGPILDQPLSLFKREVADNFTDLVGVPTNETDDVLDTTPFAAQNLTTEDLEPTKTTAAPPSKVPENVESTNSGCSPRGHKLKTLCWLTWIVFVFPWRFKPGFASPC